MIGAEMFKVALLVLLVASQAGADTMKYYLDADCPKGGIELAWLVPTPVGTHKTLADGWVAETPLWRSWKEFEAAFIAGCKLGLPCYNVLHDVNQDLIITSHDFSLLQKRWANIPQVAGDLFRVEMDKARTGLSFPARSCVILTWPSNLYDPTKNLYQACVVDGVTQVNGPNGGQWRGPAVLETVDPGNCLGEF